MRSIVIVGAGIAGVELALALAIGHPTARVTLLGEVPSLVVRPDLVYAPFGVEAAAVSIPLQRALARFGVEFAVEHVTAIDPIAHEVIGEHGRIAYDTLVVATGAHPEASPGDVVLRTLSDAMNLHDLLTPFSTPVTRRRSIRLAIDDGCTWPGPAFEFAVLLDAWLTSAGTRDTVDVLVTHSEREPLSLFGPTIGDLLHSHIDGRGIELLEARSESGFDGIDSDLVVHFPQLAANTLPGLPHLDLNDRYAIESDFAVAPDIHVIGDGVALPITTGIAAAWQARQLAVMLGARPARPGSNIDGIPAEQVTYELDLVDSTLVTRLHAASHLLPPYMGRHVEATIVHRAPRKLAGTLVREHLLHAVAGALDAAAIEFRALLAPTSARQSM